MRLYFGVPVCLLLLALTAFAQTAEELSVLPSNVDEAPAVQPAECSASLVVATIQTSGSPSYVRLKQILMAMEVGHEASAQLMTALAMPSGDSVGVAFLHTNVQLSSALNNYLCASFLSGKIKTEESDKLAIQTLITVFNRMALETIQLRSQMRVAAEKAENGQDAIPVSMADGFAKTLEDRKDAGTDLQNVIMLTIYLTIDTSDKTAKVADTLSMSARERADLLKQAAELASGTPVDEFARNAKVIQEFLTKHPKCKC